MEEAGAATLGAVTIRRATTADADSVAAVHVQSWQAAYRGHLPDQVLDDLSVERRARFWRSFIDAGRSGEHLFVVVEDGAPCGFAHAGACRDPGAPPGTGEVSSIYLAPEVWGMGRGRSLMQVCTDQLAEDGHHEAVLWVLVSNSRARLFYEATGWACDAAVKTEDMFGTSVTETRYRRPL
jgi:ribosomal protein S18 acetylase RimI-like enzyme